MHNPNRASHLYYGGPFLPEDYLLANEMIDTLATLEIKQRLLGEELIGFTPDKEYVKRREGDMWDISSQLIKLRRQLMKLGHEYKKWERGLKL
jgi:hypothetical protein